MGILLRGTKLILFFDQIKNAFSIFQKVIWLNNKNTALQDKNYQVEIKMSGEIQKQFLLTSKIGNGNFSTVYLAKHIQTQQIVAVKTMKNHISIAIKEAQLLKKMNHPNVIKIYKFQKLKNKEQALIVLQYIPQNILQLYQAQEYGLKEDQVKCILFQSCLGLNHIHKKGIIHRDIKPQNIMINRNKAEVKLIDFGLAIQQDNCTTDYVATRWYRAPENLIGTKEYTVAIDIFSLGCVIVELYMGNPLFPGANNIDQISKILAMIGEPTLHSWKKGYELFMKLSLNFQVKAQKPKKTLRSLMTSCSEGLLKLVERMLVLNPSKRIKAEQILRDPYFKDIQKIIPPNVYDQFLIDITDNRQSITKDIRSPERKKESKERVRFLSEEKSFGAFSSFKSALPLSKLESGLKRQQETKISPAKLSVKKISSPMKQSESQSSLNSKSDLNPIKKKNMPSFIHEKTTMDINSSPRIDHTDISSSIKNSIESYQKNLIQLTTSLRNIKGLKGNSDQQNQRQLQNFPPLTEENNKELLSQKSSEMLSFRGFNHPKQKAQMKQSSSSFFKKNSINDQKSSNFPIKSKKVIEYLQRFQNNPSRKQSNTQKLQNSRSQPSIYQKVNNVSPRKPQLLNSSKPFFLKPSLQKKQGLLNESQSSFHNNASQQSSFNFCQTSPTASIVSMSRPYKKQQMGKFDNPQQYPITSKRQRYVLNSPSAQKPYHVDLQPMTKNSKQLNLVKFGTFSPDNYNSQKQLMNKQNLIASSREPISNEKKFYISPSKKNQVPLAEPIHNHKHSHIQNQTALQREPSMNMSSKRPIQNKFKLIAVRDSIPINNPPTSYQFQQDLMSQSLSSTYYMRKSSIPHNNNFQKIDNTTDFSRRDLNPIQRINSINSCTSLYSPRKQFSHVPNSLHFYHTESKPLNNMLDQRETIGSQSATNKLKTKQFRSSQHRQFYTKNSPKNTTNTTKNQLYTSSSANYNAPNDNNIKNQQKPSHKNNQTTLSQLRQSITGLSQTLNEGNFLTQRIEKFNNKNIKINLNLNIYQNKLTKKK